MTAVNAIVLALLGAVVGLGAGLARWILRIRKDVAAEETSTAALRGRVAERSRLAAARDRVESVQRTTEGVVDAGNEGIRTTHTAISDIPFAVLGQFPGTQQEAKAVKGVHDAVTNGVYDAISLVNRLAGEGFRRGIGRGQKPDEPSGE